MHSTDMHYSVILSTFDSFFYGNFDKQLSQALLLAILGIFLIYNSTNLVILALLYLYAPSAPRQCGCCSGVGKLNGFSNATKPWPQKWQLIGSLRAKLYENLISRKRSPMSLILLRQHFSYHCRSLHCRSKTSCYQSSELSLFDCLGNVYPRLSVCDCLSGDKRPPPHFGDTDRPRLSLRQKENNDNRPPPLSDNSPVNQLTMHGLSHDNIGDHSATYRNTALTESSTFMLSQFGSVTTNDDNSDAAKPTWRHYHLPRKKISEIRHRGSTSPRNCYSAFKLSTFNF